MNTSICAYCQWRGTKHKNQWNENPSFTCKNPDSFKYGRRVTKGMTCNKFQSEKEREAA